MTRSLLAFALLVATGTSLGAQTPLRLADSTVVLVAAPRQWVVSSIPQGWRDSVTLGWAGNFTGTTFRPANPLIPGMRAELALQIMRNGDLRRVRVVTSSGDPRFDSVLVATSWATDRALAFPKFAHQMEGAGTEVTLEVWNPIAARNAPATVNTAVGSSAIWTLPTEIPAMTPRCDTLLREPTSYPAMTLRARLDSVAGDASRREWAARALTAMQPEFHPTGGFAPGWRSRNIFGGVEDGRLAQVLITALLRFEVDSTGHLTAAEMAIPSGYPRLDSTLVAMVRAADSSGAIPPPPPGAATNSVDIFVTTDRGATQRGVPLGIVHLGVWSADQIPVMVRPGPMRYPENLRSARVSGRVTLEFLVGVSGAPVPGSLRIISSPHPDFSATSAEMIYDQVQARHRPWVRGQRPGAAVDQLHPVRSRAITCLALLGAFACAPAERTPAAAPELVVVTSEDAGVVTLIDASTDSVIATIPVGKRPRGIKLSPDGRLAYVALSGSPKCPPTMPDEECDKLVADKSADGIGVIDLETRRVLRVIHGGSDPEQFDLSRDGRLLVVSNEDIGKATFIDLTTDAILGVVTVGGEPEGVRFSPDGSEVWVTSEADASIHILDVATRTEKGVVRAGKRPRDLGFSPDGATAWITSEFDGTITIADARARRVLRTVALPPLTRSMGVAVSADGARIYISNGRTTTVSVLAAATDSVLANIEVGARPWGLALSGDGNRLYTANGPSNDVTVIDTRTLTVLGKITVAGLPWGVAVTPWRRISPRN